MQTRRFRNEYSRVDAMLIAGLNLSELTPDRIG
jgi:hypothetical protein